MPTVSLTAGGRDAAGAFMGGTEPRNLVACQGRLRWESRPELDISTLPTGDFPGLTGRLRIRSFAEADGALYATIGQQICARVDGAQASRRLIYTNPSPHKSETGLRGLTAVSNPAGTGQVVLDAIEAGGWYPVRHADGRHEIAARHTATELPLVAVRTIARPSPATMRSISVASTQTSARPITPPGSCASTPPRFARGRAAPVGMERRSLLCPAAAPSLAQCSSDEPAQSDDRGQGPGQGRKRAHQGEPRAARAVAP